jgi:hypothetical protein
MIVNCVFAVSVLCKFETGAALTNWKGDDVNRTESQSIECYMEHFLWHLVFRTVNTPDNGFQLRTNIQQ